MAGLEQGAQSEFMKTIVVKPHTATDESQLELKVNDIVYVLEQDHTGWWGGHKEGEDSTGWFPGSCVRPVQFEPQSRPCSDTATLKPCSTVSYVQPTGPEASALHTEMRSSLRRKSLVASPQRRDGFHGSETPHEGGATARGTVMVATADGRTTEPIPSQSNRHDYQQRTGHADAANLPSSGDAAEDFNLTAENAKLRQEVSQLNEALESLRRQFEVDRRGLELVVQQERQQREHLEQRLLTETSEQSRVSNEAAVLRQQLEKEQQRAEAQKKGIDDMQRHHESQMQAKDAELKMAGDYLEHNRKLLQSEKHQVRLLEEQLQHCRDEVELQRQRSFLMPAVATVAVDVRPSPGAADPQEPVSLAEETRRRLFPSIVDDQAHGPIAPSSAAIAPGISMQFAHEFRKLQSSSPSSGKDAARGRTLNSARTGSRMAPWANSHSISGGAVRHDLERPHEQQRAASASAPRFGGGMAFCSQCSVHARSTGDLMPQRSASHTGSYVSIANPDEAPPPGCVLDRVTMFEQRCQTPRREASDGSRRGLYRADTPDSCTCQSSREDLSRATPPTLPRALQRSAPPHGEIPPAGQENCKDSQLFLGMSPMGRCQSRESFAALSSLKAAHVQSSVPPFTLKFSEGSTHFSDPASKQAHNGRDSSVPEVPVHERIRQLEDR